MNEQIRLILQLVFWIGLSATVYTYFLYPLTLMVLGRFFGHELPGGSGSDDEALLEGSDHLLPKVSMVISAYNEQKVIQDKIDNCKEIDYPSDKISFMIGSDGSDDGTAEILKEITDPRFQTFHNPARSGKVQMLNVMVEMVGGSIVIFSDANTMFQPDAVRELVKPFLDGRVGCVIGQLELAAAKGDAEACRPEGLYWRYENRIKLMESNLGAVSSINGGIFAIRRALFEKLPGHTVTEDQVLGMKIMVQGYRCYFASNARAHEEVSNWAGELRRRIRISAGNFQSLIQVPQILNPFNGRVCLSFFSHKFLRWLVPFFLLAMLTSNVLLAGEMFYGSTLLLQGLFYTLGLLGTVLPNLTGIAKVLTIPKYFITMNVAILMGFGRFMTGRQKVTWAQTQR